jgi:hypothetical protein
MHGMIKEQLMKNNFPKTLVNGLMQKYRRRRAVNRENVTECKYRSLLFVDGLSQQIQREINKVDPTIRVAFKPIRSVSKIYTRLKDRDDKWKASSIVYRIPCKICRKAYIGKTRQYMKKRISQHKTDSNCVLKRKKNADKTALTQHIMDTNHTFDFSNATILCKNISPARLTYLEMFCIRANDSCNKRTDVSKLSVAYSSLINQIRKINRNLPYIHED